ncbi:MULTISPECIES: hypothetical protein [unclassified Microbacterium]|uniref:hypothetical protein n=1 Tax=unclassified Microbacterium TaxID=2609290 RepID=UPI0004938630|nr:MULTISPECIES: hypothetical protein [unclassified Microbacterium]
MSAKRHADDQTVELHMEPDGLHIAWKDHSTGEVYGEIVHPERERAVLIEEGIDPTSFFHEIGNP